MNNEGAQLARAMLVIHAAEMEQGARCPDWRRSARRERGPLIYRRGSRMLCGLGCLMERAGRRLQDYAVPRPMPLGSNAAQR
jgi:hypothetical protein